MRLRIFLTLLCATLSATAQLATNTRPLSLEEAVTLALEHNFDLKIKRYNPQIALYNLRAVYGSYDPTLFLSGEHDYNLSPGGIDSQGRPFGGTETKIDRFSAGLQGLLPWGMTYNINGSMADQYGTRPSTIINSNSVSVITNSFVDINTGNTVSYASTNYGTSIGRSPFETTSGSAEYFQLRQPLLKNFWIDSTRLQIYLSKRNVKISELELRAQFISTITAVEKAYYDLIFQEENVKVQEKALELADQLLLENKKRVEVGTLAPLDEKQSAAQVSSSRAEVIAARGARDTQQRLLKNLLSDDYSKWKDVTIVPTDKLLALSKTFDLQESWERGFHLRPDLLQARLALEKQGYVIRFQKNQLFPELDAVGTYGFNSSSREFSGAFDQLRGGDFPFYSFGGQLTFPLSNTGARNNYRAAKAANEQIALQFKQLEQTVMVEIEDAIAAAKTSFQRADATHEARLYAEAALDAEQKKLQSGKSTSFVVLQLQKDVTSARSAEIAALADYNKSLAELEKQEGSTLDRNKIDINAK